jgi:hypothetical protein
LFFPGLIFQAQRTRRFLPDDVDTIRAGLRRTIEFLGKSRFEIKQNSFNMLARAEPVDTKVGAGAEKTRPANERNSTE